jgi:hypothetical protein
LTCVTTTTSLIAQVRYEAFKSAHQRELSRICCAEIEVDGLGSYPHIFPDVRTGMCANRQRKDVSRASQVYSMFRIKEY